MSNYIYTTVGVDSNITIDSNTTFGEKVSMSDDGRYLFLHLKNTNRTYIYDINDRNNIKFVDFLLNTEDLIDISVIEDEDPDGTYKYALITENNVITNVNLENFEDYITSDDISFSKITIKDNYILLEYINNVNGSKNFLIYQISDGSYKDVEITSDSLIPTNVIISSNMIAQSIDSTVYYQSITDALNNVQASERNFNNFGIRNIAITDNGRYLCILYFENSLNVMDTTDGSFLLTTTVSYRDDFYIGDNINIVDGDEGIFICYNILDINTDENVGIQVWKYAQISETESDWVLDRQYSDSIGENFLKISEDASTIAFSYSSNDIRFAKNYSMLQIPVTFNIENVDDPIGIVDSNVTTEVIINVRTEIDINSIFTFFIIDTGDTITYSISADNIIGTIDLNDEDNSKFYYTSDLNDFTQEVITITATDNNGNETVANLTIAKKFPIVERDIEIAENEIFKLSDLFGFNFQNVSNIQTVFGDVLIDTGDFNTITYQSQFNKSYTLKYENETSDFDSTDIVSDQYNDPQIENRYFNDSVYKNDISYSTEKNLVAVGYPHFAKVIIYQNENIIQEITNPFPDTYEPYTFGLSVALSHDGYMLAIGRPQAKNVQKNRFYIYGFNEDTQQYEYKTNYQQSRYHFLMGSKLQFFQSKTDDGNYLLLVGIESANERTKGQTMATIITSNFSVMWRGYIQGSGHNNKYDGSNMGNFAVSENGKILILNSVYYKKLIDNKLSTNYLSRDNYYFYEIYIVIKNESLSTNLTNTILSVSDYTFRRNWRESWSEKDLDVPFEMLYSEISIANNYRVAIGEYEKFEFSGRHSQTTHQNYKDDQTAGLCRVIKINFDDSELSDTTKTYKDAYTGYEDIGQIIYASDYGDASDQFGYKVHLSSETGNVLFVGAPGFNNNQGKIYIFVYNESENIWEKANEIIQENSYRLGSSFIVKDLYEEEKFFMVYSVSASHNTSFVDSNDPSSTSASQFAHNQSYFVSRVTIIEDSNVIDTMTADVEIPGNNYIISDTSTLDNDLYEQLTFNSFTLKNSFSYSPGANILVMCQFTQINIYYLNNGANQVISKNSVTNLKSVSINYEGTCIIVGTTNDKSAVVYKSEFDTSTGEFGILTNFKSTGSKTTKNYLGWNIEFTKIDDEEYLLISYAKAGRENQGKLDVIKVTNGINNSSNEGTVDFVQSKAVGNFALGKHIGIGYSSYRHTGADGGFLIFLFSTAITSDQIKRSPIEFTNRKVTNVCINKNGTIDKTATSGGSFIGDNTIAFIENENNTYILYVIKNLNYPNASRHTTDQDFDYSTYLLDDYCDSVTNIGESDYEEAELHLSNDGTMLFVSCPNDNKIEIFQYNDGTWELMRNIQPENTVTVTDFGFSMKVYEDDNGDFKIFTRGSPSNTNAYDNDVYVYQLDRNDSNDIVRSSIQLDLSLLYYSFPNEFNIKVFENEVYTFTIDAINENVNLENAINNANIEVVQTNISENIGTLTMDSNDTNNLTFQFTANSITLDNNYIDVLIGTSKSFDVTNQNIIAAYATYGDITYEYDDDDSNIINTVIYTPNISYDIVDTINFTIDSSDSTAEELDPININVVGNITTPVSRSDTYKIKLDNIIYPLNLNVEIFKKDYTIFTEQNDFNDVYLGNLYGDNNSTDVSITWDSNSNNLTVNGSEVSLNTESIISLENTQIQPNSANIIIRKQLNELTFNSFTVTMLEDSNVTFDITDYLTGGDEEDIQSISFNIDNDNGTFTITDTQIEYTPEANDYGTKNVTITVVPSYDVENPIEVSGTIEITAVDDVATGEVTLSGDFLPNTTVTVTNTIEDIDDTFSLTYTYTLTDSDSNVTSETTVQTNTFLLPDNNDSKKIAVSVNVIYTDTSKNTSFTAEADINEFSLITINSISDTNILEDGSYSYDLTTIADSNAVLNLSDVQFEINTDDSNATISIDNNVLTVDPNANYNGPINAIVRAKTDTNITTITEDISFNLTVQSVDDVATGEVTLSGDFLPNTTVTVTNTIEDIDDTFSLTYTYTLTDSDSNVTSETTVQTNTFLLPDNNDSKKIVVSVNVIYTDTSKNTTFTAEADINEFSLITTNSISESILEDGSYSYNLTTIADSNNIMSSDNVQFEINTDDSNATISIDNDKNLIVDPNADYNGPINVVVKAKTDTNITTITENVQFNLTVQSVDDSATGGISLSGEFLPNTTVTVTNTIEDIDDTFSLTYTYTLTSNDDITENTTTALNTFVLPDNNNYKKIAVSANLIYTDTSKNTSFTAEADINEFSLITTNSISDTNILEDGSYSYDLSTIADSNNVMTSDSVEFEIHTNDSNATININSDKNLTVDPNADYNGPINVVVRAKTDTNITSITEDISFNLIVQSVNDAPEFSLETITMNEDGVYSIDLNTISSDIDNDNLTFILDSNNLPQYGDALIDSNEILYYEPDSDYNGVDSFNIKISDGKVSETKTISVTINPVNDPPKINSLSLTGNFQINNDISAVLDYEDVDDTNVTIVYEWSVGSSGSDFEVDGNYTGPNFTIPNDTNYEDSTIRLKVTITDSSNEQDEETVEGTIGSINLVTTTSIDNEIDEDNIYTFELEDIIFDTDLDVQFSVTGNDNEIVIDTNTKTLTYTPESNFHGTKTFSVISSISTSVKTQTINFVVNVKAVDDLATGDITLSGFFLPNTEVTVTNTITDIDTELDGNEQFTLQYNYMVSANDIVEYEVTVSGSKYYIDGELQKQLHFIRGNTYRFTHSGYSTSNHPFQIKDTDDNTYLDENGEITIDETTPTSLEYYCENHSNMGANITVDPIEVSDQPTYILPDNNNYNKISITVEAIYTDTTKNVLFGPVEKIINEFSLVTLNDISDSNISEDGTYTYELATILDSNNVMSSDDVEFEIHTDDSNATINIDSNKQLTVEPNENYNGPINLVVRAKTDTNITTITENVQFNLTVQPVDDLATGSITISGDFLPNTYINTSFEISDIDDDTNDYTIGYKWFIDDNEDTNQTADQYLIENSSSVEGKEIYAKLVLNHSDTTKIIEIQSNTISVNSVILLNENSVNDSNLEDNEYEYDLTQLIDDPADKFNVIFEISSHNTSDGTASISENRVVTFTPTQNFESSTEIKIKASTESNYKEEEITFNVNFISQDDPLQIDESNATITINEDENEAIIIGDYLNFYTVDENDTITYSIDTNLGLSLGNVSLDTSFGTNGQMTYIPDKDVYGTDTIHVIASDGNGNDTRGIITINIINVNDPGEVKYEVGDTNLIVRAVEGEGSTIETQLNDYVDNPDNKETEFEVTNQPEIQGTIEIEESGKLIYTPTENFSGRQQINIRVKIYE